MTEQVVQGSLQQISGWRPQHPTPGPEQSKCGDRNTSIAATAETRRARKTCMRRMVAMVNSYVSSVLSCLGDGCVGEWRVGECGCCMSICSLHGHSHS